jgi:putative hydrolase of the HAD superfamily
LRAIVFDIYGTLFISGSGDISLAEGEDRSPAIAGALMAAGFELSEPQAAWSTLFMDCLEHFRQQRLAQGIEYPEVRIEEVWDQLVDRARKCSWLTGEGDISLAIVDHECRVNPCWPMPGLEETLQMVRESGLLPGIVSNAQFYTPLMFPAFLGQNIQDFGFDEHCSVWSYREREGKPSARLYEKLRGALATKGILPSETLYVGNDMRNDIWPASKLGFTTALFAGDKRSLRWRSEHPECSALRPDLIITDLGQLQSIV